MSFNTKCYSILLAVALVLNSYQFPFVDLMGLSLAQIVLFITIVFSLIGKEKNDFYLSKYLFAFLFYMSINQVLLSSDLSLSSVFSIAIPGFALAISFYPFKSSYDYFILVYKILVFISVAVFFMQEAAFYIRGERIDGLLDFLPLMQRGPLDDSAYISSLRIAPRSSSIFLEPSHFAEYIAPLLAIELFKNTKVNIWALGLTITLLLLRSGNGMIILSLIWIIWVFQRIRYTKGVITKLLVLTFIFATTISIVTFYIKSEIGIAMVERTQGLSDSTSAFMRIYRGYIVYNELPLFNQIFGLNSDNLDSTITWLGLSQYFEEGDLYFNGIQYILLTGGVIGLVLFLLFIHSIYNHNNILGKTILLLLVVLSFTSSNYMSVSMFFYISLALFYKIENKGFHLKFNSSKKSIHLY